MSSTTTSPAMGMTNAVTTMSNITSQENDHSEYVYLLDYSTFIWTYIAPMLIVFGVFGNLMTIILMQRKVFKDFEMKPFFVVLAISDTILLLLGKY